MEKETKEIRKKKKQQQKSKRSSSDIQFKPSSETKGIKFGVQFIVKSFTVRRASPLELPSLLNIQITSPLSSTILYVPTNFTILAHHAWHTLTLGLGTKKSKILIFVFETERLKLRIDRSWPQVISLGDVNKRLIRGSIGCEMARFKFRKGCVTIYVYAVREERVNGFVRGDDLRKVLEGVVNLKDFLDHTAMLALPSQRSIGFPNQASTPYPF